VRILAVASAQPKVNQQGKRVCDMSDKITLKKFVPSWEVSTNEARLWETADDGRVVCGLSPRRCKMRPGQHGFCGVRQNVDGKLRTLNYGRASHITQECIETEAIFHYAPGAPILSLGNIGCMMNCDYCQNWTTSQARLASGKDVRKYSPEEIVETAVSRNIPIISWTYNDPVVWHEFVLDTSRLAKAHGIKVLYKSAFFITPEAIEELLEVVDIFSISLKSMDPQYYRKLTKGWIEPVLEGIKIVHQSGKHLELSSLMVTDASDKPEDARSLARWVVQELGPRVPLHLVRFHPDYKYTHVGRTPIERLDEGRRISLEEGVRYCYLGNVRDHEGVHTHCPDCSALLIKRFGLNAQVVNLDDQGNCLRCGSSIDVKLIDHDRNTNGANYDEIFAQLRSGGHGVRTQFEWRGDVTSLHVEAFNPTDTPRDICYAQRCTQEEQPTKRDAFRIAPGESFRFIVSMADSRERLVEIDHDASLRVRLYEVFDRAHFPTVDVDSMRTSSNQTPLPLFQGTKQRVHDTTTGE
jgi:pyruvate formate lyase activating enzyme